MRERERDVCIKGKKDDGRKAAAEDRGELWCYFFWGYVTHIKWVLNSQPHPPLVLLGREVTI